MFTKNFGIVINVLTTLTNKAGVLCMYLSEFLLFLGEKKGKEEGKEGGKEEGIRGEKIQ